MLTSYVVYRIYTENAPNLPDLVARYFTGASLFDALGLWEGATEQSCIIEILGSESDMQAIAFLAGDIKAINKQQAVIVTWHQVRSLTV